MTKGKQLKKSVVDEIVRMYEEDRKPFLYIANYLGVSPNAVWRWLHKRGAKVRPAGGGCYK